VWDWYWLLGLQGVRQQREGQSETVSCGTGTGYWGQQGGKRAARGTERNGIVWDWYWLLGAAEGETAVRWRERNGVVWNWYWLLGAAGGVRQQ